MPRTNSICSRQMRERTLQSPSGYPAFRPATDCAHSARLELREKIPPPRSSDNSPSFRIRQPRRMSTLLRKPRRKTSYVRGS